VTTTAEGVKSGQSITIDNEDIDVATTTTTAEGVQKGQSSTFDNEEIAAATRTTTAEPAMTVESSITAKEQQFDNELKVVNDAALSDD